MSVGLLLITHRPLGGDLLRVANAIFCGHCPTRAEALEVENDSPGDLVLAEARRLAADLDTGDGVLVLTDIYGATPARLAVALLADPGRRLLAGVNLPMVVRALNYAGLDLDAVTEKALAGGRDGVRACPGPHTEE